MNKVYLIGNLTRDPEMRSTSAGIPVCNFSIAVNRRFKNAQTGQQETDFFNIVAWRQLAELCGRYLAKGRKVAVFGSIQTRSYEAQDGSKRTAFDIVADEVEFLSSPNAGSAPSSDYHAAVSPAPVQRQQAPSYAPADSGFTQVDDDELPF
ncbi:MAG: single-stranded DNA-binding protein [Clostridia bacterium]|nr:single-stranded DNA-binding protein [Clostridia bacterium]